MDRADAGGRGFFGAEGAGESKYAVSHVVGKGSYGVVCAAQNRQTQEKVAIKHIDRVLADKADTIRIIRELRFLRLLQHPNIIAVRDVLLPSQRTVFDSIYIVFELLDTDLSHLIRSKTKYDEVHIQWLLYQLFAGLRHIHAANVFHRDLKPGNILVNANCDLKICDFGLARADFAEVNKHTVFWTDYVATRWYRAPELICSYFTRYSAAVDIWAAGCICAELLRRKPLFPGHSVYHQIELITSLTGTPTEEEIGKVRNQKAREYLSSLPPQPKSDWYPLFPSCHPMAVDLLTQLLTFDPDRRLSATEAMEQPYFEMFKQVGHDRLTPPPPVMTKADFSWESEKTLTKANLRQILYDEIAMYHPEQVDGTSQSHFAPTASNEVREQFSALERGEDPARGSTSMPAEQTAPLFEEAQRMAAAAAAVPEIVAMHNDDGSSIPCPPMSDGMDMGDGVVDLAGTYAVDDRSQSISADDVRKLADSAVQSIAGSIDESAMERNGFASAEAVAQGSSWQQLSRMGQDGAAVDETQLRAAPGRGSPRRARGSTLHERTRGHHAAKAGGVGGTRDLLDVMNERKQQKKERHRRVQKVASGDEMDASSDEEEQGDMGIVGEDEDQGKDENCILQ